LRRAPIIGLLLVAVRAAALAWRWWRGQIAEQSWPMAVLSTVIDGLIFSSGALSSGAVSSGAADGGRRMVAQFLTNFLLSYMVLFVFPLQRSLIVAPWCLICYALTTFCGPFGESASASAVRSIALLAVGLCLNVIARAEVNRSKWKAFLVMEDQKKQVLKEKVLRCQAEFKSETLQPGFRFVSSCDASSYLDRSANKEPVDVNADLEKGPQVSTCAHPSARQAPSLCSAPTVLLNYTSERIAPHTTPSEPSDCHAMDCLPPDALVWVEGEALPWRLEEVQPGQRVRCFDRLSGQVKHAAVQEVKTETGMVEWTTVALADGTVLDLTADHPMQPVGADVSQGGLAARPFGSEHAVVRAAALRPGVDHLLALKVEPVPVQSVQTSVEDRKRVFLTVQQPERHAIFVARATPESGGPTQPVAVESACMGREEVQWRFGESKTFMEVSTVSTAPRRPASAPPSLRGRSSLPSETPLAEEAEKVGPGLSMPMAREASGSTAPRGCNGESAARGRHEGSTISTISSRSSGGVAKVTLGMIKPSEVRLSDMMAVHAAGLPSRGSQAHAAGNCKVCVFENVHQYYGKKPCFKGAFCERCHFDHVHYRRLKRDGKNPQGVDQCTPTSDLIAPSVICAL